MLKVEWLKLRRYRPFWLLLAFYPLSLAGTLLICLRIWSGMADSKLPTHLLINGSPWVFPKLWNSLTYLASFFHFFPCMLILLVICNEFEFRTHRQNLLDGWTRLQFFSAKVLLTAMVLLLCWTCLVLVTLGCGAYHNSLEPWKGLEFLGYFMLQSSLYAALALAIGFWLKRGLLAMGLFTAYTVMLEGLLGFFLRDSQFHYYLPLSTVNLLISLPSEVAKRLSAGVPAPNQLVPVAFFYLILLLGLAWNSFRRQDL